MHYNDLIPEFVVRDIERSRDFYMNLLDFKLEYERPEDKFLFLSFGNAQLMLEEAPAEEAPKKKNTAKSVLANMEAKIAEGKNQSREGLTPEQLEVLDMADMIEQSGQPGFANAMRQNVLRRTPLTIQNMDFYRKMREQFMAEQGKGTGPVTEAYTSCLVPLSKILNVTWLLYGFLKIILSSTTFTSSA